jgi:hypothetical protein
MEKPAKRLWPVGVLLILGIFGVVIWMRFLNPSRPRPEPPEGAVYYTGPMKSKGDPNVYGTDEGKQVAPPPGAVASGGAAPNPARP